MMIKSSENGAYIRPELIIQALKSNSNVYYLGVGSNLLKEKVMNRGVNGSNINLISFGAARVDDHRLAFNMRGDCEEILMFLFCQRNN
jgi:hypothetical protein